jgi:hypothetical protein
MYQTETGMISGSDSGKSWWKRRIARAMLVAAVAPGMLFGCKATEAPSTGYTTMELMDKDPSLPFHKVWRKPGVDFSKYRKIYVADVDTRYMLAHTTWDEGERQGEIENDVRELAVYTKAQIEKEFREDPNHRFQVLKAPSRDKDAVIFEVAITEIVPSKVLLNALGYVAPFGIGMAVAAVRYISKDESSAAFEARVRDGSTNVVIAMVADREAEQLAIVSVRGMTWYSHAKAMIDQWAHQFVQVANRKPGEKVEDTDAFTLKPW